MTTRPPFATVLLDVDGTLIDSNGAHAETWTQALAEHGLAAELSHVRSLVGMGGDKLLPEAAGIESDSDIGQQVSQRKKQLFSERLPQLTPTTGARDLLQWLHDSDVDVVIATSADQEEMRSLLDRAGVADLVPERTSKSDASASKPDPDIIQAALDKADGDPKQAVMVGDTPYDIEAAQRAGVKTIALRCGGHWTDRDLTGALEIFDDPAALLERWRSLGRDRPIRRSPDR